MPLKFLNINMKYSWQILALLICFAYMPEQSFANDTYICDSGSETFRPRNGDTSADTVIATDSCDALVITCNRNNACENLNVFAAADTVRINCARFESCRNANINIGLGTPAPRTLPSGYTDSDFDGRVSDFTILCGNDGNDENACREMNLNVFESVTNQTIDCNASGRRSCVNISANLYNDSASGSISLLCGAQDTFQCDSSSYNIQTAGASYSCQGATCQYIACPTDSTGCNANTVTNSINNGTTSNFPGWTGNNPGPNVDPDDDMVSDYYDQDDDGNGLPDEIDEYIANNPGAPDPDTDSDADNIPDVVEIVNGTNINSAEQSVLDEDYNISPKYYRFGLETLNTDLASCNGANAQEVLFTVTNTEMAVGLGVNNDNLTFPTNAVSVSSVSPGYAEEFKIVTDNCSGATLTSFDPDADDQTNATAMCTVGVVYCPQDVTNTARSSAAILTVSNSNSSQTPYVQVALHNHEGNKQQAQRRLPPVGSEVIISPGTHLDFNTDPTLPGPYVTNGELIEEQPYTFEYTITGYHDLYQAIAVVFDCSMMPSNCGLAFVSGAYQLMTAGFETPGAISNGTWFYGASQVQNQRYRFVYTAPTVSADQEYVLRIYRKSTESVLAGDISLSLLLPGSIPLPVDESGRLARFTVKNDD